MKDVLLSLQVAAKFIPENVKPKGIKFEEPCSKTCRRAQVEPLQGMFCLAAVLRSDRKEVNHFLIRSHSPQQATGNALAGAVQTVFASVDQELLEAVAFNCRLNSGTS